MDFVLKPDQTILFTGDSITDCDRQRAPQGSLGDGYVHIAANLMMTRYPKYNLKFINTGISGNTVADLAVRWTEDVIAHRPDWVSVMIGINDLCQFLGGVRSLGPESYAEVYDSILQRIQTETDARLILVEPFFMRLKPDNERQARILDLLDAYLPVVQQLARKYRAHFVRTQAAFQSFLQFYPPDRIGQEAIHPNLLGHTIIAHAWLQNMAW